MFFCTFCNNADLQDIAGELRDCVEVLKKFTQGVTATKQKLPSTSKQIREVEEATAKVLTPKQPSPPISSVADNMAGISTSDTETDKVNYLTHEL